MKTALLKGLELFRYPVVYIICLLFAFIPDTIISLVKLSLLERGEVEFDPFDLPNLVSNGIFVFPILLVITYVYNTLLLWLSRYAGWRQQPLRRLLAIIAMVLLVSLVFYFGGNLLYHFLIHPVALERFKVVVGLLITHLISAVIVTALDVFHQYRTQQMELLAFEQQHKENAIYKLELLNQLINPHFLFNSLNSLSSLIVIDPGRARKFVRDLSALYRDLIELKLVDKISLARELEITHNYIRMLRIRYPQEFDIRLEIEAGHEQDCLIPFSTQILLENAIKHNKFSAESPLVIRIYTEEGWYVVENTLNEKDYKEQGFRLGLDNLRTRYQLITGKDINVQASDTTFRVALPIISSVYASSHH